MKPGLSLKAVLSDFGTAELVILDRREICCSYSVNDMLYVNLDVRQMIVSHHTDLQP